MLLAQQVEAIRREHDEILQRLSAFEEAFDRANSDDWDVRCEALGELREMDATLAEINEHCRHEEEELESPFELFLEKAALARLRAEHDRLRLLISDFRRELRLATVPRTAELITRGRDLLQELRRHVAEEEELLAQIQESIASQG
jgi:hemerythrin-like domain-containing protein